MLWFAKLIFNAPLRYTKLQYMAVNEKLNLNGWGLKVRNWLSGEAKLLILAFPIHLSNSNERNFKDVQP